MARALAFAPAENVPTGSRVPGLQTLMSPATPPRNLPSGLAATAPTWLVVEMLDLILPVLVFQS